MHPTYYPPRDRSSAGRLTINDVHRSLTIMHWHISHRNTAITALVLTLSSTPFPAVTQNALPQVASVGDGDTLRVRQGNQLTM